MGVTEQFCRILAAMTAEALPPAALEAARSLMLDGIAVALAGSRETAPTIIAEHIRSFGGAEQATVFNFGFKTSSVSAAYLNGASMHVLDYEPMWNPPTHALSTTLPAVLALGESLNATGKDILAALIKGIEAHGRLRVASRQYEPRGLVFHPPGVAGPIGSAVAAAHLLNLGPDQLRNAIGIAASRAGTLMANIGTMTKCTHCGNAAAAGLDAALLAARGLNANPDVIEGSNGLADAFFDKNWDRRALTVKDAPLRILDPGYAIKLFPSQYATHFVILAALDARERIPASETISSVDIIGPTMPYVDRPRPSSGLDAKFSFQYAAASALLDGTVGIETFSDERWARSDMSTMLSKVSFMQSSEIPATLDRMWVEIKIRLSSGSLVTGKCVRPRGSWGSPISGQEHLVKVRDCMRRVLNENDAENAIASLLEFERLDQNGIHSLMRTLGNFQ
ncbi:MAG: MmgE/PrpD family protein [Deltaproteobacteria bacterium]|nr:MmgE/PrpD family protein [Deltaproteobacteria bacterium]